MRPRIKQFLRALLCGLGVVLLAWLPVSTFLQAYVAVSCPAKTTLLIISTQGRIAFMFQEWEGSSSIGIGTLEEGRRGLSHWLWPVARTLHMPPVLRSDEVFDPTAPRPRQWTLYIPLWLLAFICLAWPVTSFIIHRRRHKRGFPVEPKGAGDSVNTSAS